MDMWLPRRHGTFPFFGTFGFVSKLLGGCQGRLNILGFLGDKESEKHCSLKFSHFQGILQAQPADEMKGFVHLLLVRPHCHFIGRLLMRACVELPLVHGAATQIKDTTRLEPLVAAHVAPSDPTKHPNLKLASRKKYAADSLEVGE